MADRSPVPLAPDGTTIVLASASPRRRDLLEQLGVALDVRPADVDERVLPGESIDVYVARVAGAKADAAARRGEVVLAADTAVDVEGMILGKPADPAAARAMLERLSGAVASVHSAVVVQGPEPPDRRATSVVTEVEFTEISRAEVDWYVGTGEWEGRAGAFSIQSRGGLFVRAVRGSFSNVVGLPLAETAELLRAATNPQIA